MLNAARRKSCICAQSRLSVPKWTYKKAEGGIDVSFCGGKRMLRSKNKTKRSNQAGGMVDGRKCGGTDKLL